MDVASAVFWLTRIVRPWRGTAYADARAAVVNCGRHSLALDVRAVGSNARTLPDMGSHHQCCYARGECPLKCTPFYHFDREFGDDRTCDAYR